MGSQGRGDSARDAERPRQLGIELLGRAVTARTALRRGSQSRHAASRVARLPSANRESSSRRRPRKAPAELRLKRRCARMLRTRALACTPTRRWRRDAMRAGGEPKRSARVPHRRVTAVDRRDSPAALALAIARVALRHVGVAREIAGRLARAVRAAPCATPTTRGEPDSGAGAGRACAERARAVGMRSCALFARRAAAWEATGWS